MFKAFVDEDIRKRFCILIRNENDVDKLLDYLKYNNIRCFRNPIIEIDKSSIMDSFKLCRISHPNFYLYVCYNEFTKNFRVSYGIKFYREEDERNCYTVDDIMEENEMNKEFTKSDLKTGMIVETRKGVKYVVLLNTCIFEDLIVNGNDLCWNGLSNYNDELIEHHGYNELDIVKVYKPKHPYAIHSFEEDALELIWEREEYKEMTVAEIEKELGYKVKIVKEKENE